jgi:hypothetical protein
MRKIQAYPATPESWILQEWGNRLGVLTCEHDSWHLISTELMCTNVSLEHIQQQLKAELEFHALESEEDSESDQVVENIQGLPVKHMTVVNVLDQPRVSYTRTVKGVTRYAAGYWAIHFNTGWSGSLCPKCATLDQYEHKGPFTSKLEMNTIVNKLRRTQ